MRKKISKMRKSEVRYQIRHFLFQKTIAGVSAGHGKRLRQSDYSSESRWQVAVGVGATLGWGEGHRAVSIYPSPLVACALNDGRPGTVYMIVTLRALVPGTHSRCSINMCYMDSERMQDL